MSFTMSRWPALFVLTSILCVTASKKVAAEEETLRFELFSSEGARYRFDKVTGELHKLVFKNGIPMWVKQDVRYDGGPAPTVAQPTAPKNVDSTGTASVVPTPTEGSHATPVGPQIQIFDENNNDVSELVSDSDRKNASAVIANYENKLSILHTVKVGDKIEGNVMVRNSGDKKLKVLELTMVLVVNGKDKPEEHHLLFIEKKGSSSPPQPSVKGSDGAAVMRVNIPCPAGGVKGSPELKLTYLQFDN